MTHLIQEKELLKLISDEEIKIFIKLQELIKELNKKSNLTRLIEGDDYWISQVFDSIWPLFKNSKKVFNNKKFIDIGSGCGFPGLAYAITHPNSEIYLIDSSTKKINSLKRIIKVLNLKTKIFVINDRIENLGHISKFRNKFDIGTIRAVSSPQTVAEYILPMLKNNGIGILYCGKWSKENQNKINKSLLILKGEIIEIKKIHLPANKGERNVIFIKPKELCPRIYPREIGKAKKYPLGN